MNTAQNPNAAQIIANAGFDLDLLDQMPSLTHKCGVIFDDNGDPVSGFIMVGKNSAEYQANQATIKTENIQRAGKRKKAIDTATEEGAAVVTETMARNDRSTAMAVVTGFFGFDRAGKPVEFSKDLLETMFNKMPQWQAKVLNDLDEEANFSKAS